MHKQFKGTVLNSNDGLIQYVTDNFDAQICSQNGIKQTHGLASIVTQPMSQKAPGSLNIPRVAKKKLSELRIDETNKKTFLGVKNPEISEQFVSSGVLPLKVLSKMALSLTSSKVTDFKFIKASLTQNNVPDYNGYCTAEARISGKPLLPETKILYQPYIDESPTDPSTILTAMEDAEQIAKDAGQKYTVFTADQQLYAIVLNIVSCNPKRWEYFIPRLGGMHWLVSFIGACGSLMKGSGLHQYLSSAFAGVSKMLIGKKFPMNMRALRLAAFEILRDHVDLGNITCYDGLIDVLESLGQKSNLAEHWIENLIKPVLLMMMFVKAEREGDFALHLLCCRRMMPYFFAAKHVNYARYGICYINTMEKLPPEVLNQFMNGDEHVMRHQEGIWNAIWSDMMIETSYMKIGKGPAGVIGFTTSSTTMSVWAKSMHAQTTYLSELHSCSGGKISQQTTHKMESKARIDADEVDRSKLRSYLKNCIHPLDTDCHTENQLCNIVTGQIAEENVNVNKSVMNGKALMTKFTEKLPQGFRSTISSTVITMTDTKRQKKSPGKEQYSIESIFSRVCYLMSIGQIDTKDLFSYELSPFPTSLCYESGLPHYTTTKSDLKNALKCVVSNRNIKFDSIIIDGNAMLHSAIHWPKGAEVKKLVEAVSAYIFTILKEADVYLIFDRYYTLSIKSDTRRYRQGMYIKEHKLMETTQLPSKEAALGSIKNKTQLIELISMGLLSMAKSREFQQKLVVTSAKPDPLQCQNGHITVREDLRTTHEEADVIIPMQLESAISEGRRNIAINCEDTDVFVLICHLYQKHEWESNVFMKGFSKDTNLISIQKTVANHADIMPYLPACHILTGCDTVPQMFRIRKKKALAAGKQVPLEKFMQRDSTEAEYMPEAKRFVAACYGCKRTSSSENRKVIWEKKAVTQKMTSKGIDLKSLPPTDECLELNIQRARFQLMLWDASLDGSPPNLDPCKVSFLFIMI